MMKKHDPWSTLVFLEIREIREDSNNGLKMR